MRELSINISSPEIYVSKKTELKYMLIYRGNVENHYIELKKGEIKIVLHENINRVFYYYGSKLYDEDLIRNFSLFIENYILSPEGIYGFENIMIKLNEKFIGPKGFRKVEPIYIDADNAGKIYETRDGNTLYCQINMNQAVQMGSDTKIINLPEEKHLKGLISHMFNFDEVFKVLHKYNYKAGMNQVLKNKERSIKEENLKKEVEIVIENGILTKKKNLINFRNISRINYSQPGVGMKECIFFYDGKDEILHFIASEEEYNKIVFEYKKFFEPKTIIY